MNEADPQEQLADYCDGALRHLHATCKQNKLYLVKYILFLTACDICTYLWGTV